MCGEICSRSQTVDCELVREMEAVTCSLDEKEGVYRELANRNFSGII